jgi:hypothetical protein
LEAVLQQQLVREKGLDGRCMLTDTTAHEKHVVYPTDTALLDKGRRRLLTLIGQAKATGGVVARGLRSFCRTAKRVVLAATKLGKDQLERIERVLAQLNGKLGALRRQGSVRAAAAPGGRHRVVQAPATAPCAH